MSDLISRQSLIKHLQQFAPEHYNALVNQLIMAEPIAYDLDRVVEQLNETREIFESRHIVPCINMDRAIEIVKRGGIDDGNSGN